MARPSAVYLLSTRCFDDVYGPEERAAIESQVDVIARLVPEEFASSTEPYPGVRLILAGWGMPPVDEAFLRRFPDLEAIFYAAGSIRGFATETMWARGIRVTSAYAANAIPVAEFALSQILYALKNGWRAARAVREARTFPPLPRPAGGYRSTVGLLSLGMIGRMVANHLRHFDLRVIAYDPFLAPEKARELGVELAPLDEVFARADVVSCHTPILPETERLLKGTHFAALKPGATFLNTARGRVVAEDELIAVLRERPDLTAVLDVAAVEPPPADSPLYDLPNVVLTPHIAGSQAHECRRMGQLAADELRRYLAGEPMRYELDEKRAAILA